MADPGQVVLVRHGHPDWGATEGAPPLSPDLVPLSPRGQERILTCVDRLSPQEVQRVVSSPLTRALQSAHILAAAFDAPLVVDAGLREWVPDTTGPGTPGRAGFQGAFDAMVEHGGEWPPGASQVWEPFSAVRSRTRAALAPYAGERVAVVTHAVLIFAMTGMDVPPGGMVRLDWDASGELVVPTPEVSDVPLSARQREMLGHVAASDGERRASDVVVLAYELLGDVDVRCLDHALTRLAVQRTEPGTRIRADESTGFVAEHVAPVELAASVVLLGTETVLSWMAGELADGIPAVGWWPLMAVNVLRSTRDTLSLTVSTVLASVPEAFELGAALMRAYAAEVQSRGGQPVLREDHPAPRLLRSAPLDAVPMGEPWSSAAPPAELPSFVGVGGAELLESSTVATTLPEGRS